jgi:hypothetical protein
MLYSDGFHSTLLLPIHIPTNGGESTSGLFSHLKGEQMTGSPGDKMVLFFIIESPPDPGCE